MRQKTGKSAHRAHRSKLGLRLALTVFLSIAVVEAVVLVPSYRNYESDLLERLAHAGGAAVMATFGSHAHATERDLGIYAKIMIAGSDELTGIALYRLDGALIGTHTARRQPWRNRRKPARPVSARAATTGDALTSPGRDRKPGFRSASSAGSIRVGSARN